MILKISLIPITAQVSFDLHYSDIVLKGKKASNIKMNFYLVVLLVIIGKPGFCFYYLFVINQSYHTITSITVYSTCFYPFRPNLFFIHPSNWAIQMVRSLLFTKKNNLGLLFIQNTLFWQKNVPALLLVRMVALLISSVNVFVLLDWWELHVHR